MRKITFVIFILTFLALGSSNANEINCEELQENGEISSLNCLNRQKRQGLGKRKKKNDNGIPGGARELSVDDPDVKLYLREALVKINGDEDPDYEPLNITKATVQVVAGTLHRFEVEMKRNQNKVVCQFEIWERVWIPNGREVKVKCNDEKLFYFRQSPRTRSKRSINHHLHHHHHHNSEEQQHHRKHHKKVEERYNERQLEEVKGEVLFESFIEKYKRRYANDLEHNQRLKIFKRNLHKIEMLNKHERGTAKYGITEFSDMTQKEYLHKTGLVAPERHENDLGNPIADVPDVALPDEFDWRNKGAVTDVKNQGNCGSCWSFSVTGNIEGLHAIKTGKLEAYSEQELLDCDTTDNACNGGYMDDAFKAIEKIGGLELENEYPYMAKKQKKCLFNQTMSHVRVKGVVDLPKGDEVAMQKFLVSTGPISIGINANAMQFYRGGVSHPWKVLCRKGNLDHGVLIVGYGTKEYPMFNKTLPYWTIKNSWGPKWGEQGYYRVYRGDNTCGVAEMASSAVLE